MAEAIGRVANHTENASETLSIPVAGETPDRPNGG
jgi:hypothetical protein